MSIVYEPLELSSILLGIVCITYNIVIDCVRLYVSIVCKL